MSDEAFHIFFIFAEALYTSAKASYLSAEALYLSAEAFHIFFISAEAELVTHLRILGVGNFSFNTAGEQCKVSHNSNVSFPWRMICVAIHFFQTNLNCYSSQGQ